MPSEATASKILYRYIPPAAINEHKLIPLCQECTKVLEKLIPEDQELLSALHEIEDIACKLEDIDHKSIAYRYPIDKKGRESTKHHQVVDLDLLSEPMEKTLETLDTIDFGIHNLVGPI